MFFLQGRKRGFTIVELVIVIAVIAILTAVLIPTFSALIEKSHHSTDVVTVTNINKLLSVDSIGAESSPEYSKISDTIIKGGYSIPLNAKSDGYDFYWIPDKNRVVLFDKSENSVDCPEILKDCVKSDGWVNLSLNSQPPTEDEPHKENPEQAEPETEEECILLSGSDFNAAVKSLCGDVTKIVFEKTENCKGKISENYKKVSSGGTVNAYCSGTEIYVLCDTNIEFPQNFSNAFSQMKKLTSVEFNNIDTSKATDMSYMFKGCTALTSVDLSSFNTASVTNTTGMFEGCSQLTDIYVTASDGKWVKGVTDGNSKNMFSGCEKLPNYKHDSDDWRSFFDVFLDFIISRDVRYAHTGKGGYLTGK